MLISRLIELLQQVRHERGDLKVYWSGAGAAVEHVDVVEESTGLEVQLHDHSLPGAPTRYPGA